MKILYIIGITIIGICMFLMMGVVAVLIVLTSGFPIIFRQKRVGKNGTMFTIYKFRTMILSAEKKKSQYRRHNESDGPVFKIYNDPRFTPIGKFLSHTGLDELPQLFNVLRGDMTLIGPRPLPVFEAKKLKPWMRVRESVLPGIISPAILTGSYHKDFNAWMRYDASYVKEKNPQRDLVLCFEALPFMGRMFMQSVMGK